jgi:hypothetical protein
MVEVCRYKILRVTPREARFVESYQEMQFNADTAAELAQQVFGCTYEVRRKGK